MTRTPHHSTSPQADPFEQGGAGQGRAAGRPICLGPNCIGVSCYNGAGSLLTARASHEDGTDKTGITGRADLAADAPDRRPCLAAVDHLGRRSGTLFMAAGQRPGSGLRAAHIRQAPRCHAPLPEACSRTHPKLKNRPDARQKIRHISTSYVGFQTLIAGGAGGSAQQPTTLPLIQARGCP